MAAGAGEWRFALADGVQMDAVKARLEAAGSNRDIDNYSVPWRRSTSSTRPLFPSPLISACAFIACAWTDGPEPASAATVATNTIRPYFILPPVRDCRSVAKMLKCRKLVLFDIDGTLVLTGGAGMRAMNRACEEIIGHVDAIGGRPLAGRTD